MPVEVMASVPVPTATLPNNKLELSISATLLLPLFDKVTAPAKILFPVISVMGNAPAEMVVVPGAMIWPACVTAPPEVTDKLPPLVKVVSGTTTGAAVKSTVKFCRLVNVSKLAGSVALALTLSSATLLMLLSVPHKSNTS